MTTALRAEYQHNFAGFHNLPHLDALLQFFCEQQYFIRTSTVHKQPEKLPISTRYYNFSVNNNILLELALFTNSRKSSPSR